MEKNATPNSFLGLAGVEEVQPRVGADGPVGVLPAAVDAREGLLVEEHLKNRGGAVLGPPDLRG